jgi:hypothetical protein
MRAAILAGHDLDVFVPRPPVAVFVLDAGIRKVDMTVVVRQVVFARPSCDLPRLAIRSSVAIPPAAIAFVEKPLVVGFSS